MVEQMSIKNDWDLCKENWLESRRSDNTRRSYDHALGEFLLFFKVLPEQITRQHVRDWANELKRRGLKSSTICSRLAAISSFFSFACNEYQVQSYGAWIPLCENNPAELKSIRPRIVRFAESRALSTAECKQLLAQCDLSKISGQRDYVLLRGYMILGRRNSEWRLAKVCNFEVNDGKVFFRWAGKGKSDELIMVPESLWKNLQEYISNSGGRLIEDYIFRGRSGDGPISDKRVGAVVTRYARLAGIKGRLRVHDLRHTAAMLRRENGADVEEIRDFLKHSNLAVTQIYLHRLERNFDNRGEEISRLVY
ncbi:MAG: hypothetical protein CVU46_10575 [Chloroflexi bacterium HGW-Chloroflexi-8]|nr:MAG: hypothetical protein CVU46_10575 [Chloroflexi bacterium HGW-Chloroflexi-8]